MKVSDNTAISMPMRNLLSILAAVAVGVVVSVTVFRYSPIGTIANYTIATTIKLQEESRLSKKNTE